MNYSDEQYRKPLSKTQKERKKLSKLQFLDNLVTVTKKIDKNNTLSPWG